MASTLCQNSYKNFFFCFFVLFCFFVKKRKISWSLDHTIFFQISLAYGTNIFKGMCGETFHISNGSSEEF